MDLTWHQDNCNVHTPNGDDYINVAVAIDSADETNGALIVIPKSHKLGDLPAVSQNQILIKMIVVDYIKYQSEILVNYQMDMK